MGSVLKLQEQLKSWFCDVYQARLAQSVEHETLNLRVCGFELHVGQNILLFMVSDW